MSDRDASASRGGGERAREVRTLLLVLFTASGFAGLIYESIWTHYLKLFLGHAAYAQALVLAIFMGGMAIGSWLAARLSPRWQDVLRAYAMAEAVIGTLALVFHPVFVGATALSYDRVLPALVGHPVAVSAFKWGLSALLLLPQSVLLGMTFPLMTAGVLRAFPDRPGRSLSLLYFTNSIGAAVGVLASGFVLVPWLGLPGTTRFAGALNLGVALLVWLVAGALAPRAGSLPESGHVRATDRQVPLFLLVSAVTGASSFVYEVAWIRLLSLILGGSTHAFELMLSAFILGIALGGLWIQRVLDRLRSPLRYLAIVQVAMGLLALATLPLSGFAFDAMQVLVRVLPRTDGGYTLFNLASSGIAVAVMLPATFCAGMTLPLITYWLLRQGYGESSVGRVYAANTVGGIVAVFFAIHLGMPLLGMKNLLAFGAGLDLLLGLLLAWRVRGGFRRRWTPLALMVASAVAVVFVVTGLELDPNKLASGVYRTGEFVHPALERVLEHRDGKTATVSVIAKDTVPQIRIATNGKVDASMTLQLDRPPQADEPTMILLGAVPMALHPRARTAACIGFGSGLTTHTLLLNPALDRVDTIEIEPEMIRAARHFRPRNELAYDDPRSRIHVDDAKTFFSTSGARYDIIISEPSNPWVSGVAGLFSDEFYRHVRRHLADDGLFVQWIQLYEIDVDLVVSVLKAIEANFGDYVVFAASDVDAIVVARNGTSIPRPDPGVLRLPSLDASFRRAGISGPQDLEVHRIGDHRSWRGLTSAFHIPPNSDYFPVLDQGAARARFLGVDARNLLTFARNPLPLLEMLSGAPERQDRTVVSEAPYFEGSRHAFLATAVRDLLLRTPGAAPALALPPDVYRTTIPLANWMASCDSSRAEPFPLQSLLSAAEATVADLGSSELRAMWAPLQKGPCAARIGERDRQWVDFIAALGSRDAASIVRTADMLLARGPALAPQTTRYLVAASMLGSIAQGRPQDAAALWSTYSSTIHLGDDYLLRLLVARASASRN